jgi:hypothetical protein
MNSLTSLIVYIYHVEYIMTKSLNENKKKFKKNINLKTLIKTFKNVDWLIENEKMKWSEKRIYIFVKITNYV